MSSDRSWDFSSTESHLSLSLSVISRTTGIDEAHPGIALILPIKFLGRGRERTRRRSTDSYCYDIVFPQEMDRGRMMMELYM